MIETQYFQSLLLHLENVNLSPIPEMTIWTLDPCILASFIFISELSPLSFSLHYLCTPHTSLTESLNSHTSHTSAESLHYNLSVNYK